MNIQSDTIDDDSAGRWIKAAKHPLLDITEQPQLQRNNQNLRKEFVDLISAIHQAERPLMLMGGGCSAASNRHAARKIVDLIGIPVVLSLMAVDLLPGSHPQRVGFIGSYGNRWANKALGASDVLIVIGSRLDIRQTGSDLDSFCEGKQIWQIDIDESEIGVRIQPQHSLCCSIHSALQQLAELAKVGNHHHFSWRKYIDNLRSQFPASGEYPAQVGEVNPVLLLQKLSGSTPDPCIYVTDVGQHQMWAAQSLQFKHHDRFLTSGGMGAMGFGLPVALGTSFCSQDAMTVLISGDGSLQVNIQELETVRRNQPNLKIVLFNNQCHGMVRQFQETYFKGRLQSTVEGYSSPDFAAISRAYGIPARKIHCIDQVEECIQWLLCSNSPSLLEVPLSLRSRVYPKLAFGRRFGEMEPEASPVSMEST